MRFAFSLRPNVASKRREGLNVAHVGWFHPSGDPVLDGSEFAFGQAVSQRFKRDIFKPIPLKKLGRGCVYVS